jgi:NAD-dependent deacetylase
MPCASVSAKRTRTSVEKRKSTAAESLRSRPMSAEALAELIRQHSPCVALTGAGISTESGIPDFRSPTGLWARFDPLEYGSIEAFRADPLKVWSFYKPRVGMLTEAQPNPAHQALAELERLGLLEAVVTQNIDLLHERAGSRDVVEVHGSIRTATCPYCGEQVVLARVLELLAEADAPQCPACEAILKPDVVFFGELLPAAAIERATELARGARLLLVVGSALEVYPVAGLPSQTLQAGGKLAIVNRGPTPYDDEATVRVESSAGEVLPAVVSALA